MDDLRRIYKGDDDDEGDNDFNTDKALLMRERLLLAVVVIGMAWWAVMTATLVLVLGIIIFDYDSGIPIKHALTHTFTPVPH